MRGRSWWSWALDTALAFVIAAVGLAEVWVPFESVQGEGSSAASSIAIVLCGVALVFRRAYPLALVAVPATWVAVAIASGGDIQVLFFGQLVPMYFALYSGARYGTPRVMAIVCGSVVLGVLLADLTVPALQTPNEIFFHWAVLIAVFALGWGMRMAERRAIAAGRRASEAESSAREQALRAIADERSRIARELHDVLGHSVSVMVVQAGAAAQVVDDDPEFVRRALETIRSTGVQSLAEVRRVVTLLRDDEEAQLGPQPGMAQLPALIESMRVGGLYIDYNATGDPDELGAGKQLAVYRIVQEALTNVARHAEASRASVTVTRSADAVVIDVVDDGVRSPVEESVQPARGTHGGHGLIGMQERAAAYGGHIEAGPQEEGGWRVRAVLPAERSPVAASSRAGGDAKADRR